MPQTVEHDFPLRIATAARAVRALAGEQATIIDRLYAYEIQEAGRRLASAEGLSDAVRVTATPDRISFTLIGRSCLPGTAPSGTQLLNDCFLTPAVSDVTTSAMFCLA